MKHVTLLFLKREDEILLAMKKRGFGVDKWNGVGGKLEPGESPEDAAIRECEEEIEVTPTVLTKVGEHHFFDLPDVEHYCHVYIATEWEGEPRETEEMRPQWFKLKDIPYKQMWPDDEVWVPVMLEGKLFKSIIVVDNDRLLECHVDEVNAL